MGQSLAKQYTHIIFSTKYQEPLIIEPVEQELYKYIGGICKSLECNPIQVGGYKNHVHILCILSKKIALMTLLEEVKANSSRWIKTVDNRLKHFSWQNGYGAFSVNPLGVSQVEEYIANQHEHHRKRSFKEEYLAFLDKFKIDYDERYLWD